MTQASVENLYQIVENNLTAVMQGQAKIIRLLFAGLVSGGHVLLEDYPGTGKTTLSKALAKSVQAKFQRIQFTPDLLPSDILGVSIFNPKQQSFDFHSGPIFTDILLADEINRASPRTQSALLEAMAENQVSIERDCYSLGELFFVIATQNPIEFHGTYPLPEAQMDRFALRLGLGYVNLEQEVEILKSQAQQFPLEQLKQSISIDDVLMLRQQAKGVKLTDELLIYIVSLVAKTREIEGVSLGASPRASLTLMKVAQALALLDGLTMVTPDHVQELAIAVLAHRLTLDNDAKFSGITQVDIVNRILDSIEPPL